ncbi:MAG: hypothetical protein J6Y90_01425, partial [Lachnospiraceae bacterium]|nr:hypothetical protein [Lachnospiraceae bacterium]
MNRIADGTRVNYHLFMNSVTGISDIISRAGLTPENCRVICADNRKNCAKLPDGFKVSKPSDPVKQVNFYTSTCFEGCDLFDENGRTFIICDPNKPTSMLDISTSMLQICGRIRNSKFKGELTLIYNTTRYEECDSLDLYMKRIEDDIADAHQIVAGLNQCPEKFRLQIAAKLRMVDAPFIRLEKGELVVDQNMINLDIINYRILHGDYKTCVNLENRMQWNGFDIERAYYADTKYVGLMSLTKLSFKECCEKYEANKPQRGTYCLCENETLIRLRNLCPDACEAVDKLGIEEIRRMKYNRSNIHRKVLAMCGAEQDLKIKRELDRRLKKWEKYTVAEIK